MQNTAVVLLCIFALSGCGDSQDHADMQPSVEIQDTYFEACEYHKVSVKENRTIGGSISETLQKMPTEENGLMEIYAGRDIVSVSEKVMIAQVSPQEHGNQGLLTYYCFLQTESGFVESPTFTDISNPAIDTDDRLILSQWRNSAASHSWAEYQCQDNAYVMYRELCEYPDPDSDGKIWVWTVNGREIARSDELSNEEIWDLLYSENSEWGIAGDRWRTLYNNGLTTDYSIYSEP